MQRMSSWIPMVAFLCLSQLGGAAQTVGKPTTARAAASETSSRKTASSKTADPEGHEWWQNAVFYEIYPRSFADSNNDGVGDLNGITSKLDYLRDLGVDAIWITPCFPSPQVDFGYDVSDYENIDPMYGTMADFDNLASEAKKRGIRIILDFVVNHSSDQHKWFLDSKSSRTSEHRNWYIWRDGKGPGQPPNNWTSLFGGPAWTFDTTSGQYYYHAFLKEQPDLAPFAFSVLREDDVANHIGRSLADPLVVKHPDFRLNLVIHADNFLTFDHKQRKKNLLAGKA